MSPTHHHEAPPEVSSRYSTETTSSAAKENNDDCDSTDDEQRKQVNNSDKLVNSRLNPESKTFNPNLKPPTCNNIPYFPPAEQSRYQFVPNSNQRLQSPIFQSNGTGYRGPTNESGFCGPTNGTGYRGPTNGTGFCGPTNESGNRGPTNGTGFCGPTNGTGFCGPTNESGYRGPTNGTGFCGPTNGTGFCGPTNESGYRGPTNGTGFGGPPLHYMQQAIQQSPPNYNYAQASFINYLQSQLHSFQQQMNSMVNLHPPPPFVPQQQRMPNTYNTFMHPGSGCVPPNSTFTPQVAQFMQQFMPRAPSNPNFQHFFNQIMQNQMPRPPLNPNVQYFFNQSMQNQPHCYNQQIPQIFPQNQFDHQHPISKPPVYQSSSIGPKIEPGQGPSVNPKIEPGQGPTVSPKIEPGQGPTISPKREPGQGPTVSPKREPGQGPTISPKREPGQGPTIGPKREPGQVPTIGPKREPGQGPTIGPKREPGQGPTIDPKREPGQGPTIDPKREPGQGPTIGPKGEPGQVPTVGPKREPGQGPTIGPRKGTGQGPTIGPKREPGQGPTIGPKREPGQGPTIDPKREPGQGPTIGPKREPGQGPTIGPKREPGQVPTVGPKRGPGQGPTIDPKKGTGQESRTGSKKNTGQISTISPKKENEHEQEPRITPRGPSMSLEKENEQEPRISPKKENEQEPRISPKKENEQEPRIIRKKENEQEPRISPRGPSMSLEKENGQKPFINSKEEIQADIQLEKLATKILEDIAAGSSMTKNLKKLSIEEVNKFPSSILDLELTSSHSSNEENNNDILLSFSAKATGKSVETMTTTSCKKFSTGNFIIHDRLKEKLLILMEENPEGIWAAHLLSEFKARFKMELDVRGMGYTNTIDMVNDLPDVFQATRPENYSDFKLHPVGHLQSKPCAGPVFNEKREIPERVLENVISLMTAYPKGMKQDIFERSYIGLHGEQLNYRKYGFEKIENLIQYLIQIKCLKAEMHDGEPQLMLWSGIAPPSGVKPRVTPPRVTPPRLAPIKIRTDVMQPGEKLPEFIFPQEAATNQWLFVYCSEVFSPERFYMHIKGGKFRSALNKLMIKLQSLYKNVTEEMQVTTAVEGLYVACLYYGEWHRALVTEIYPITQDCKVFYIDYGTVEIKKFGDLYYLYKDVAVLAPQAVLGSLYNISPKSPHSNWPIEATSRFHEMSQEVELFSANIISVSHEEKSMEVCLSYQTAQNVVIHINDQLVMEELAEFTVKPNKENFTLMESSESSMYHFFPPNYRHVSQQIEREFQANTLIQTPINHNEPSLAQFQATPLLLTPIVQTPQYYNDQVENNASVSFSTPHVFKIPQAMLEAGCTEQVLAHAPDFIENVATIMLASSTWTIIKQFGLNVASNVVRTLFPDGTLHRMMDVLNTDVSPEIIQAAEALQESLLECTTLKISSQLESNTSVGECSTGGETCVEPLRNTSINQMPLQQPTPPMNLVQISPMEISEEEAEEKEDHAPVVVNVAPVMSEGVFLSDNEDEIESNSSHPSSSTTVNTSENMIKLVDVGSTKMHLIKYEEQPHFFTEQVATKLIGSENDVDLLERIKKCSLVKIVTLTKKDSPHFFKQMQQHGLDESLECGQSDAVKLIPLEFLNPLLMYLDSNNHQEITGYIRKIRGHFETIWKKQ